MKADEIKLWFVAKLKPNTNAVDFIEKLKGSNHVEAAEFAPLPAPPPDSATL